MAGIYKLYVIGSPGGYMGSDGVGSIYLQILVGTSSRMWYEPHYFQREIQPMGKLRVIVPEGPDDPDALLDACVAFFPEWFKDCPSLAEATERFGRDERMVFSDKGIPRIWRTLREEARERFAELPVWEAELSEVHPVRVDG
jgi:hypothetical protein